MGCQAGASQAKAWCLPHCIIQTVSMRPSLAPCISRYKQVTRCCLCIFCGNRLCACRLPLQTSQSRHKQASTDEKHEGPVKMDHILHMQPTMLQQWEKQTGCYRS